MSKEQVKFLESVDIDPNSELDVLEDKVADYLEMHGISSDDEPNDIGIMCLSILDWIGEQQ